MALRDSMRASAGQFLQPGEQIHAVIGAQTQSQYLMMAGAVIFLAKNKYRIIVATDRRLLILDTGRWSVKKAKGIVGELPRATRLGPPSGGVWHTVVLGPEKLRIHRRFFKDIAAADGVAAQAA
jgi:hypothetical protein